MFEIKAAIYTRKSKYTEEGESIENQIHMCIDYAEKNLGIKDYVIYQDEGFTGGNTDRPQFQKMMKDLKDKEYTHLICYRLDRISRSVADFSATLEMLNKIKVSFISIKEQFDTSSAMGRAMLNISATFAQLERETIAERIKDNLRELGKTGRWLGGPPPLGYKSVEVENNDAGGKSRKKHILAINENEVDTIKALFKLFMEHKKYNKTATLLNELGYKPRHGKVFNLTIVKQAINNPVYIIADKTIFKYFKSKGSDTYLMDKCDNKKGLMPYHRRDSENKMLDMNEWIISVGDHDGIITSDEWLQCQKIKDEIKSRPSSRHGSSKLFLLSGLIVCSKCGSSMSGRHKVLNDSTYRYYTCNLRNRASSECCNDSLNAYDAEEYVVKNLKSITRETIIYNYKQSEKRQHSKVDNDKLITKYNKEIETNKTMISNLVKRIALIEDDIVETFMEEIKKLKENNIELQSLIDTLEKENSKILEDKISVDDILRNIEHFQNFYDFTEGFEKKQDLIRSIVKFITWDSENRKIRIVLIGSDEKRPTINPLLHL